MARILIDSLHMMDDFVYLFTLNRFLGLEGCLSF